MAMFSCFHQLDLGSELVFVVAVDFNFYDFTAGS